MGLQFGFGSGIMYGTRSDIAGQSPVRFGAMQDVSIDFDGEIKELYAQSQYAIDSARGKTKIQGKAKFAQISVPVFNNLYFGGSVESGQTKNAYNEAATVAANVTIATSAGTASGTTLTFTSTTGANVGDLVTNTTAPTSIAPGTTVASKTGTTVTLSQAVASAVGSADSIVFHPAVEPANQATFVGDLGVYYANTGDPLTFVLGTPATGEYTEVDGNYFFASGDSGVEVLLNYLYTTVDGFTLLMNNPFMGTTPRFQGVFSQTYNGQQTNLTLFSCVANKLQMPTKIDDYVINELDFMAFQNSAGYVFSMSTGS